MKKRILSVLLVLTMLVTMLTACGGTNNGGTNTGNNGNNNTNNVASFVVPEGGYDGSEVTIVFYHTMGAKLREVLDRYIVEFNKLYPNIKIDHQQVGSYDDVRDKISKFLDGIVKVFYFTGNAFLLFEKLFESFKAFSFGEVERNGANRR